MMKLKVISYNGQPPAHPIEGVFDELGGAMGRAESNAFVLPDPERYVSRTHADIVFRAGSYFIRNVSSASPLQVNDQPLGKDREAKLSEGDRLVVGGYLLRVVADAASAPGQQPAQPQAAAPRDDPLALFGGPAGDPFGQDLAAPPKQTARRDPDPGANRNAGPHDIIPTGFDPFGDLTPIASVASTAHASPDQTKPPRLPEDVDLGLGPGSRRNIDELFHLGPGKSGDPFAGGHPLGDPAGTPETASSLDPLVAMGGAARKPAAAAQRDDGLEIHAAYTPPAASRSDRPERAEPPEAGNILFSWNEADHSADGVIKTVVIPSPRHAGPARGPGPAQAADPENVPTRTEAAMPPTMPAPAHEAGAGSDDDLLQAFLRGAGVPDLAMQGPLTPETMATLGRLLRASTQAMLDLLLARALIKREFHADVTVIATRENNPLKFSPNAEAALAHLLAPRGHGFMTPVEAITDACNDLRAHQFGFMAGMRAALDGVLRRFDPARLEQRLAGNGIVDSMLPMHRKARLWAQFVELYADINHEAQEDFHALFGKEFLRAYQSQLDELESPDAGAGGRPGAARR